MSHYYMFNKPRGPITANRDERHPVVMDYFPIELRDKLFAVGRLDKDTEGLILITDDGKLTYKLLDPESKIKKTYFFIAEGEPLDERIKELFHGVKIYRNRDDTTAPADIKIIEHMTLRDISDLIQLDCKKHGTLRLDRPAVSGIITITEGKKHQVKRMIRYAGAKVVYLKRLSMASLILDENLPLGSYRELTPEELDSLLTLVLE